MVKTFDELQKAGDRQLDLLLKSFAAISAGAQTIAAEITDYSQHAVVQGNAAFEKLLAAKSVDKALDVQGEYARQAYEGFVSRAARLGELYADLAKQSGKPFEAYLKTAPAR